MSNQIILGGRYEIISKIGAGGMADVYKGKDLMLNRFVAIKVLKKEFREDETFVRKFKKEAQAAAGLLNPNIVNVYDVGEDRGLNYMVQELVDGITLKQYIAQKGRLSSKEVVSIAIQMCSGIEAAHIHHIIHRDIKPQNIMISKEGKVKVTDFGIARAASSNTVSSNAMGSVHYTSPEQARGGFSDEKSDIYSVGITLFEMVTGQVPFDGKSTVEVAVKHLQEEITPPSELVPNIPYSLEQIILKCTMKSADRRYPNMQELMLDLKRSLVDPDGDFVKVVPLLAGGDTVMITPEELNQIQRQGYDGDNEDEEYDSDEDDEYEDEEYQDDEYGDEEYDDENPEESQEDVDPKMKKVTKILMIVAAVILAFVLIFAIGKAAGLFKFGPGVNTSKEDSNKVEVPDLTGKTEDEAKKLCNDNNLGFKVSTREESEKYEEGRVISQSEEAGTKIEKNTQITVVVSSGLKAKEAEVPDVTEMSESEAQKAITDAGFKSPDSKFEYSNEVEEGNVIETSPKAGEKVSTDTTITMTVSKGSEKISVPNLVGKTQKSAKTALENAGLSVGNITSEYSDSVAEGKVISQSKAAGKKVDSGTSVSFVVSKGKETVTTEVPSVVGLSQSNAKKAIQNAGLNYAEGTSQYSDTFDAGVVMAVTPNEGKEVDEGTTVTVIISKGPQTPTAAPTASH